MGVPQLNLILKSQFIKPKVKRVLNKQYCTSEELYDLVHKQKIQWKFRIVSDKIIFINENPVLSLSWHFYRSSLITAGKLNLIEEWNLDDAMFDYDTITKISDYAFNLGFKDYMLIMHMKFLYGWVREWETKDIPDKIRAWANNNFKPKINDSEEEFNKQFRTAIREILRWREGTLNMDISAETYCADIAYTGTSGSGYDPGGETLRMRVDGEKFKISNSKFAKSGALSIQDKMFRLFNNKRQKNNVSIKPDELYPKIRLLVASDFSTSMQMRYIDVWLRKWMHGNVRSTLWMTKEDLLQFWKDFTKEDGWNIPLDQVKFDHHVTVTMILIILDEILQLIIDKATNNSELIQVMMAIIESFKNAKLFYKDGTTTFTFDWTSGLLSGWQWTAFFGTIINIAQNMIAQKLGMRLGLQMKAMLFNAQGDDDALKYKTLTECVVHTCMMREMGFEIHPQKTFYSKHHNEYLRRYYYKGMINGYPARMVAGLMWRFIGEKTDHKDSELLSSTCNKWLKYAERLFLDYKFADIMSRRDLKGMKMNKDVIQRYFLTPMIYGGPAWNKVGQWKLEQNPRKLVANIDIEGKGYQEFKDRFGYGQSIELEQWYLSAISMPDRTKDRTIFEVQGIDFLVAKTPLPLRFNFTHVINIPKPIYNNRIPKNVVFGKTYSFLSTLYPNLDSFVDMMHAPKSWITDYLLGQLKVVTPPIAGLSQEFASLVFHNFEPSLIYAMYYKKTVDDKWLRLQQYAIEYFSSFIHDRDKLPLMY